MNIRTDIITILVLIALLILAIFSTIKLSTVKNVIVTDLSTRKVYYLDEAYEYRGHITFKVNDIKYELSNYSIEEEN